MSAQHCNCPKPEISTGSAIFRSLSFPPRPSSPSSSFPLHSPFPSSSPALRAGPLYNPWKTFKISNARRWVLVYFCTKVDTKINTVDNIDGWQKQINVIIGRFIYLNHRSLISIIGVDVTLGRQHKSQKSIQLTLASATTTSVIVIYLSHIALCHIVRSKWRAQNCISHQNFASS